MIEVKNGFVPEVLLEQLHRQTPLEDSFSINAVALVDGQPRTLGPQADLLEVFLEHRYDVVTPPLGAPARASGPSGCTWSRGC